MLVKAGTLTVAFLARKTCQRFWIYFWVIPVLGMVGRRTDSIAASSSSELQFDCELCGAGSAQGIQGTLSSEGRAAAQEEVRCGPGANFAKSSIKDIAWFG